MTNMTTSPMLHPNLAPTDAMAMLARLVTVTRGFVYRRRHDPAWTMDFVSDGCRDITGYDPHRFIANASLSFADLIQASDRERVENGVADAIAHRRRRILRYRIRTAYGAVVWVEDRLVPVFGRMGSLTAIEGIIDSVTDDPALADVNGGCMDAFADVFRRNPLPLVLSRADGAVCAINAACVRRFNLSAADILAERPLDDLLRQLAARLGKGTFTHGSEAAAAIGATSVSLATPLGHDTVLTVMPPHEPLGSTLWWRCARRQSPPRRTRSRDRLREDGAAAAHGSDNGPIVRPQPPREACLVG